MVVVLLPGAVPSRPHSHSLKLVPVEESRVYLPTDIVFPLAKNEIDFKPVVTASVFKGSNQAYCLGMKITASSGVVGIAKGVDRALWLENIKYTVLYAHDGRCIIRYDELLGRATTSTQLQVKTMAIAPKSNAKDWGHFHTAQEDNLASHQEKDGDPIHAVCQFILPFKVLKNITHADYFSLYDPKTGGYTLSLLFWHADQSGRTAVQIENAVFAPDSDDDDDDDDDDDNNPATAIVDTPNNNKG